MSSKKPGWRVYVTRPGGSCGQNYYLLAKPTGGLKAKKIRKSSGTTNKALATERARLGAGAPARRGPPG